MFAVVSEINPMTAAGDLIAGGTNGTPTRLGIGPNGSVLTVVAGALAYASGGFAFASLSLTSPTATAFTVAAAGLNYGLQVDESTANAATGLRIKAAAAGAGIAVSVLSSGAAENLTIDAKGTGTITLAGTSTGGITLGRLTTVANGLKSTVISAGALPTVVLGTGTGAQVSTTRDVSLSVAVTYNPTAGASATCLVELSPDNATYSTLGTVTIPLGIALDGTVEFLDLWVPAGWYVRLTVTNATIGTATYW